MCGIAGFLELTRRPGTQELEAVAHAMAATLAHRGPDARGVFVDADAGLGFGHTRLSIVDLSPAAVRFSTRANGYLERVIPGAVPDGRLPRDDGRDQPGGPALPLLAALGRQLDDVLGQVIGPLAATGGAGERALWAIAVDSLATSVLAASAVTPGGSAAAPASTTGR